MGESAEEVVMKLRTIYVGLAGVVLVSACAGNAIAGSTYFPDGINCSLLSDAELVACQNQQYTRQLESGISAEATGPEDQTVVPTSHIGSSPSDDARGTVIGAETDTPLLPEPTVQETPSPTLVGPEGTTPTIDSINY
jgi:hypothetical protein